VLGSLAPHATVPRDASGARLSTCSFRKSGESSATSLSKSFGKSLTFSRICKITRT
jgi:hypothetical protein